MKQKTIIRVMAAVCVIFVFFSFGTSFAEDLPERYIAEWKDGAAYTNQNDAAADEVLYDVGSGDFVLVDSEGRERNRSKFPNELFISENDLSQGRLRVKAIYPDWFVSPLEVVLREKNRGTEKRITLTQEQNYAGDIPLTEGEYSVVSARGIATNGVQSAFYANPKNVTIKANLETDVVLRFAASNKQSAVAISDAIKKEADDSAAKTQQKQFPYLLISVLCFTLALVCVCAYFLFSKNPILEIPPIASMVVGAASLFAALLLTILLAFDQNPIPEVRNNSNKTSSSFAASNPADTSVERTRIYSMTNEGITGYSHESGIDMLADIQKRLIAANELIAVTGESFGIPNTVYENKSGQKYIFSGRSLIRLDGDYLPNWVVSVLRNELGQRVYLTGSTAMKELFESSRLSAEKKLDENTVIINGFVSKLPAITVENSVYVPADSILSWLQITPEKNTDEFMFKYDAQLYELPVTQEADRTKFQYVNFDGAWSGRFYTAFERDGETYIPIEYFNRACGWSVMKKNDVFVLLTDPLDIPAGFYLYVAPNHDLSLEEFETYLKQFSEKDVSANG